MKIADLRRKKLKDWFDLNPIPATEKSYISQLIHGKASFGEKAARRLEITYNMPINYLDDSISGVEIDLENNPDYPAIRKVHLTVSAGITGYGVEPCEGDDSIIVFKADWYKSRSLKPEKLLAVKVSGASMEPKLYHGDSVVFNTADTHLKDGVVYVFNLDGEVVIKRAARDNGMWWLDSDNPDKARYPRKACTSELCMPLGRVVHMQSERI